MSNQDSPPQEKSKDSSAAELRLAEVRWVLLDIEGTTCPVHFVAATLFPYASSHLQTFVQEKGHQSDVQAILQEVLRAWECDPDPIAATLLQNRQAQDWGLGTLPYLQWLIQEDRKLAPLKELQGLIWEEGYSKGELIAPLFDDVPEALKRWHSSGRKLAVYSSGSIAAQQLLYAHTPAGDLRQLFTHWFDTRTGPKKESDSYRLIAAKLMCRPEDILFISDSVSELEAAEAADFQVLFSLREGNPENEPGPYREIRSYNHLL